jgi:hypothetical protein
MMRQQLSAAGSAAGVAAFAAGSAARYAAWAARDAAWSAARDAAWDAARCSQVRSLVRSLVAAGDGSLGRSLVRSQERSRGRSLVRSLVKQPGDAARYAAWALMVKDLITPEQFDLLYGPWASVMGS